MIEEIVDELIKEAREGKTIVHSEDSDWVFYAKFYVNESIDTNYPTLEIPNKKAFINSLKEYLDVAYDFYIEDKEYFVLNEREYLKKLIFDLIINMSQFDCIDVYHYIENKKNMLTDKTVNIGNFILGKYENLDVIIDIRKNRANIEAPYQFVITLKDKEGNLFELPQLTFAISNKVAYLVCVQNKNKDENLLIKKMDRYFRKVNKDVDMNDDVSKVSPRALVSLTIFNSYLKSIGIREIEVPSYLPIRYNSKLVKGKYRNYSKEDLEDLELTLNHNQYNMTNKMMYLLERYQTHFDGTRCVYDDIKDKMYVRLNDINTNKDNIINELDKQLNNRGR